MRKYIHFIMISLFLFAALVPLRVRAASGDGLRMDEEGTVTIVSQHAAKEGISSLCFSLSVESANAAAVEFQFGESKAKILDYRYDQATGSINVYLAGTEALFAQGTDSLTVGRIKALDGNGNEVAATVSAVENSLRYVYGTELKTMQEVELPGAVQIGPAAVQPPPSQPENTPKPDNPPKPENPPSSGNPSTPGNPPTSQVPAPTQAPVVLPPQLPVAQPTPKPVQPPRATERPRPTEAPVDGTTDRPSDSESQEPEGDLPVAPELGEDTFHPTPSPDGEDKGQNDEEAKGVDVFVVVAVVVVLVVVAIEVMAFVVLKKPGRPRRGRRG